MIINKDVNDTSTARMYPLVITDGVTRKMDYACGKRKSRGQVPCTIVNPGYHTTINWAAAGGALTGWVSCARFKWS